MKTLLLRDDTNGIQTAADLLKEGGVVAIPTETVYGLACNAYDADAVRRVFVAKGRPQDNPLIVHVASMDTVKQLTSLPELPEQVVALTERFWPGPLTIVLPRNDNVPSEISAGLDTVAVRMPSHPVARAIIEQSGVPLAAPSANLSGKPSPTTAQHVIDDLSGKIDAIVQSGNCTVGVESTVVHVDQNGCRLLRPGKITVEQLQRVVGSVEIDPSVTRDVVKEKVSSPGMKYKHYSPNTNVILVEGTGEQFSAFMQDKTDACAICFAEDHVEGLHLVYGSMNNPETLAQELFRVLREVDTLRVKTAYVHAPQPQGVGLAVYNRLLRAAAFQVVTL